MIYVVATVTVKPGMKEKYLEIFKGVMAEVHKEKGCVQYIPAIDHDMGWSRQNKNENTVVILERWETPEDLDAHGGTAHMESYRAATVDMIEHVDIRVLRET